MRTFARAVFFLLALPAIARAAARLLLLERRLPLDALVERLRATTPFTWSALARPAWLLASLDRLLPLLPPWRYGRCLERSLLLLDLWSRCGLRPRLHLGVRRDGEAQHEAHAWVTVEHSQSSDAAATHEPSVVIDELATATSAHGYPEAFVL